MFGARFGVGGGFPFPGGSNSEESVCNAGRCPGEENHYPLQYSCLVKPMDRSLVGCSPWGCKELE